MKVLIAEDDPISRRLLEKILTKWGYEITLAFDGTQAWNLLQSQNTSADKNMNGGTPRLAIMDWMMPGMDGLDVCRKVREQVDCPYVYILLLTARSEQKDFLEGMEAGADDYITKPFDVSELKVRLRAGRRLLDLQTELISAQDA